MSKSKFYSTLNVIKKGENWQHCQIPRDPVHFTEELCVEWDTLPKFFFGSKIMGK